jgi:NTP pyrophosphatase (non-canonical NTP hydrolase)
MNFQQYNARLAVIRVQYKLDRDKEIVVSTMGLAGETGEVCEIIKKDIRDGNIDKTALKKELGDVLAYLTNIANMYDISLEDVAIANIDKLESRMQRGTLRGSGDDR